MDTFDYIKKLHIQWKSFKSLRKKHEASQKIYGKGDIYYLSPLQREDLVDVLFGIIAKMQSGRVIRTRNRHVKSIADK